MILEEAGGAAKSFEDQEVELLSAQDAQGSFGSLPVFAALLGTFATILIIDSPAVQVRKKSRAIETISP